MEGHVASLPESAPQRSAGELAVIWTVVVATLVVVVHQLVTLPLSSSPAPIAATHGGPAHVTRFDVMYAHSDYTRLDTFQGPPSIVGNSGMEVLVAGKLSRPLATANLVLADGTRINAEKQALGDPNNPVARFRFELQDSYHGAWHYQLSDFIGDEVLSGPLLLLVLPKEPTKTWPTWPDEPAAPSNEPAVTVT